MLTATKVQFQRSPLRYPGGKSRAVKFIEPLVPQYVTELCAPFLGGASLELAWSDRMVVYGYDIFKPVVVFWKQLLVNQRALVRAVKENYPLDRDSFYWLQKNYETFENPIDLAAAFYVLNRSSFSGTTLSGGMSPGHPRFTPSAIQRLADFHVENFYVEQADFRDSIINHPNAFLYLDPPYVNGQALYGKQGDTHKGFDHQALADLLWYRDQWIMSYNDSPIIRSLYEGYPIMPLQWTYGMGKTKTSSEILVLSKDLSYLVKGV